RGWVATIGLGLMVLAIVFAGVSLTANAEDRIIVIRKAAGKDGQDIIQVLPNAPVQVQALPQGKQVIILQDATQQQPVRVQATTVPQQRTEVVFVQGAAQPQQGMRVQATTPKVARFAGQDIVVPNIDVKDLELQVRTLVEQKIDVDAIQKAIEKLEKHLSAQEMEQVRKALEQLKQMKQWRHMIPVPPKAPEALFAPAKPGDTTWTFTWPQQPRLGLKLSKPSAILADQLNLPKGQGLVITEVTADSAGAKAGLKANDILMKVGDILVADDVSKFTKALEGIKAGSTVDAWVLRRGKEETIRGLKVPEAGARVRFPQNIQLNPQGGQAAFTPVPNVPGIGGGFVVGGAHTVMTTSFRDGDRFNTRYQEGSLIITLVGKVTGGKAVPDSIHIQDGQVTNKYENVNAVPAQYRDKVNHLLQVSSGASLRIDTKSSR
ncbi:MAG: PDZ domain-containing protein, partial [Gemmataceae bacterium]|nr:PDZ domain-containing protein [Gemmataceae bacterium]